MKATDMLNKVKELVGAELKEEAQEVELAQATLENGTVIESETFEVGSEVFIVTDDEKVALPVGEYTLEDGEQLVIEEEVSDDFTLNIYNLLGMQIHGQSVVAGDNEVNINLKPGFYTIEILSGKNLIGQRNLIVR
jgi:hypothetical protein